LNPSSAGINTESIIYCTSVFISYFLPTKQHKPQDPACAQSIRPNSTFLQNKQQSKPPTMGRKFFVGGNFKMYVCMQQASYPLACGSIAFTWMYQADDEFLQEWHDFVHQRNRPQPLKLQARYASNISSDCFSWSPLSRETRDVLPHLNEHAFHARQMINVRT
jgi:hypothetical protein